ncbi:MAG: hybrid sensor histidine kinase/response regulator [Hydrogenophaga sp.]|uniref:ATP-binding response regulator n=1 Tax=Hydrogenophaga sp. TaxID=1904254 RepID=UPI001DC31658|nr:hybrid sensor histidine kinase/response regulator [Hydrogenophaga sp.]MBX3608370.1 hybrid sensor histidine kinase/response regulator [Hydrogenophaga sp.]
MAASPDSDDRLRREQVRLLAGNVPALVTGTLVLAAGTSGLLWINQQSPTWILIWLAAMVVLCLFRLAMAKCFARLDRANNWPTGRWARWFVWVSCVAGLLWGSLAWAFFTPDQPLNLATVAIVLMSITSSATQSLAPSFAAHLAFALPCVLPFELHCMLSEGLPLTLLGGLACWFLLMAEVFARRVAMAIEDALRLRFDNESLVAQLTAENLRTEQANQSKTRFLAAASHDLRQPIHAMALFVPALKAMSQRRQMEPTAVGIVADRMQGAIDTMTQLLNRLLDVSRLDAGAMRPALQPVALAPLMRKVCDEVTHQANVKGLSVRCQASDLCVHTDPAILHTILSNLAANAVRYTQRGGILLAARRRGSQVLLQVWDTGAGIAAADLPRVTEEFFQVESQARDASQSRGFGLGLAIVRRSTELLGSSLQCRSQLGRGSVFGLTLPEAQTPIEAGKEASVTAPTLHAASNASPRLVLVVDNDERILTAMTVLLRSWGHDTLAASSLAQASRLLATPARRPDVALVDMHLDADVDGLQAVDALRRQLDTDLRALIITGDTSASVAADISAAHLPVMLKPIDPVRLRSFIETDGALNATTPTGTTG